MMQTVARTCYGDDDGEKIVEIDGEFRENQWYESEREKWDFEIVSEKWVTNFRYEVIKGLYMVS